MDYTDSFFDTGFNTAFDTVFSLVSGIITIGFIIIIGFGIYYLVRGTTIFMKNNASPRLSVDAKVVSKRVDVQVTHHHRDDDLFHSNRTSRHYVTFELNNRERMEFLMSGKKYGLLIEGDQGRLDYQGTRFHSFERY